MKEEELKLLIGAIFIKGKKAFVNVNSKSALAKMIVNSNGFKENMSYKSLTNYYTYYFQKGERANPSEEIIRLLINYWSSNDFQSYFKAKEFFQKNKPSEDLILKNLPFQKSNIIDTNKGENKRKEIPIDNKITLKKDSVNIQQTNIFSIYNFSKINKLKGKIKQLNFLSFGNKQEINIDKISDD